MARDEFGAFDGTSRNYIREALDRCPDEQAIVTCRGLDYVIKLEGLQKVAENSPALIFLDMMMPVMGGMEFMHELQATTEGAGIPVVAVAGTEIDGEHGSIPATSFADVIRKGDDNLQSLMQEVSQLLNKYKLARINK